MEIILNFESIYFSFKFTGLLKSNMRKNNAFPNGIVFLGAGNVATHLALEFFNKEFIIRCIYSQTIESAEKLAKKVKAGFCHKISMVPDDADFYIISVKDDAIERIAQEIKIKEGVLLHTAGGVGIEVLKKSSKNCGVFYPLQTFSKSRKVNLNEVPFFIESNNETTKQKLIGLAHSISDKVYEADSEKRKMIHLAAVFSCNFVNHMFTISSELLNKSGCSFEILKPLVIETVNKAMDMQPQIAQTGPALRNDKKVLENHLKMLSEHPEFEKIYRFVSESIYNSQTKKEK